MIPDDPALWLGIASGAAQRARVEQAAGRFTAAIAQGERGLDAAVRAEQLGADPAAIASVRAALHTLIGDLEHRLGRSADDPASAVARVRAALERFDAAAAQLAGDNDGALADADLVAKRARSTTEIARWVLRLSEFSGFTGRRSGADSIWSVLSVVAILGSALGALMMVRPNRWTPPAKSILAAIGFCWYVIVVMGMLIVIRSDIDKVPAYGHERSPDAMRIIGRMVFGVGLLGVLLCMRPIARELVKRSLALRTGRVDRQTILAMSSVVVVGLLGDSIRWGVATDLVGAPGGVLDFVARLLVVFSSMLLTLGLLSAAVDSWRISSAILTPSPSMSDLFGEGAAATSAAGDAPEGDLSEDGDPAEPSLQS